MSLSCQILASFLLIFIVSTKGAAPENNVVWGTLGQDFNLNITGFQMNDNINDIRWEKGKIKVARLKMGHLKETGGRYNVSTNGALKIKHLKIEDSDSYRVVIYATNGKNILDKTFQLKIQGTGTRGVPEWSSGDGVSRRVLPGPTFKALCRGRVVRVPTGSLVRVVGTELVIPCNVSDYDGPSEQNFDWSFSSSGSSFVELASTWEAGFAAQLYRERLQRGEIVLRRTANDAVELHIKNVQPSDEGHYKCSTPSTDATVQGNYEDTVQVKGYEDKRGAARRSVLALTHEGRFRPGPGYEQRYRAGDVRLDTVGGDGYRLAVTRTLASDQGSYRCVVSEWIGEQGSWQEIQEKAVEVATVLIQPTVLRAAVARSVSVAEGKELDLTCNITTDRADDVRPEVTWYFGRSPDSTLPGSPVLARLDRDSLVHSSPHVALSHVDARSYHLLVRDVSKENSGYYFCHVALWAPGHNRSWYKVAEARSAPASVDVTWLGPLFNASVHSDTPSVTRGDLIRLFCIITVEGAALDPGISLCPLSLPLSLSAEPRPLTDQRLEKAKVYKALNVLCRDHWSLSTGRMLGE
ncbi:prostaglandin F2 receptor negative regulator [Leptonychotes weddellii]|uniref:Prostaglandin F2 receptor negative regulator n=1 Tax=Leptonychotes weddellii TaxID=9713 RepID=A0A7F8RL54_LEPWE|nr:prostaglandin F2 receptor negative regulator [Leptonychotes weddellii]